MWFNYILEWFSWILLFFSWAMLIRVAMKKRLAEQNSTAAVRRKIYWTSMITGIICFTLSVLFIADPITAFLVGMEYVGPESGPVIFLVLAASFFLLLPFLIVPVLISSIFRNQLGK